MMRRLAVGLLWAVPLYVVAAGSGFFAINALSGNTHDREIEAAMTGAFVVGPLGACVGFVIGVVRSRRQPHPPAR